MKTRTTSLIVIGAAAIAAVAGSAWWSSRAQSMPIADVSHIHGIAVNLSDPARLYLATHEGVFLASPDGTAEQVSNSTDDYMSFIAHPSDADTFFASGHPKTGGNSGFLVSRDGTRSWEQVSPGVNGPVDFHAMTVSPADPNVLYGLYGEIQTSADGGKTWEVVGPAGQPASFVTAAPDGTVYAFVVGSGLVRLARSANEWEPITDRFGNRILIHFAVDPTNPDNLFAVTQNSEVIVSADGGKSWMPLG